MAAYQNNHTQQHQDLPQILVLYEQRIFDNLQQSFSHKFHFIYLLPSSSTPIDQYLISHNYDPSLIYTIVSGFAPITAIILSHFPSLGLLVTPSAGTNHIDLQECSRRGIKVANVGTVFSEDVADVAVAMFIDLLRRISAGDRYMRRCRLDLTAATCKFPLGSKVR